jgi:hypothetical protein
MPPRPNTAAPAAARPARTFAVNTGVARSTHKVCLYGKGGSGKTTLASLMTQAGVKPLFLDLEGGTLDRDVARVTDIGTFDDLRDALHSTELLAPFGAVVVDTATRAEELAVAWTLANVQTEKGAAAKNIKSYGWGDGDRHVFDTFLLLLQDLDAVACDRHVVLICHAAEDTVPNPAGQDYLAWQPRLQKARKGDIRSKVKEWCDHLLFIDMERFVDDGKAMGDCKRIIHPAELPHAWAKSRTMAEPVVFEKDSGALWAALFGKEVQ